MKRTITMIAAVFAMLVLASTGHAQFGLTGTTSVAVTVAPEAALQVNTATSTLTAVAGTFANNFLGTTSLTYKVRTTKVGGTGTITAKVTTDFGPAGGPSVATPPTAGDTLGYTCTVTLPGTGCVGTATASTAAATALATFGADAKSAKAGNAASLAWTLTNDPLYSTGSYTATVTFTISAT